VELTVEVVLIVPEAVGVPVEESVAVAVLLGVDEVEGVESP